MTTVGSREKHAYRVVAELVSRPFALSCHLLAASRPVAPFGKAVHTDKDASAAADDAGKKRACFSTASVSRPSAARLQRSSVP